MNWCDAHPNIIVGVWFFYHKNRWLKNDNLEQDGCEKASFGRQETNGKDAMEAPLHPNGGCFTLERSLGWSCTKTSLQYNGGSVRMLRSLHCKAEKRRFYNYPDYQAVRKHLRIAYFQPKSSWGVSLKLWGWLMHFFVNYFSQVFIRICQGEGMREAIIQRAQ